MIIYKFEGDGICCLHAGYICISTVVRGGKERNAVLVFIKPDEHFVSPIVCKAYPPIRTLKNAMFLV
jgi:hypothetical protein